MYYIDINKNKFVRLSDYYKNRTFEKIKNKDLLYAKKLLILKNGQKVYATNNIQSLYLYPLNILEYIKYAKDGKTLMYNILDINGIKNNYNILVNSDVINIEFLINEESLKQFSEIIKLSKILKKNNKKISINLKTLNIEGKKINEVCSIADYLKVALKNFENEYDYENYLNKIKEIKKWSNKDSVIHIKGYLNEGQIKYYEKLVRDTKDNVDVIQISKELIPLNCKENPQISKETIRAIRNLEASNEKFISVKDLSNLYYDRFELDERNSHKCYVWYIKPYIQDNYILPCKVNKVITNIKNWKVKDILASTNTNNTKKYGKKCDDCASIFENDTLAEITKFYNNDYDLLLEIEEK